MNRIIGIQNQLKGDYVKDSLSFLKLTELLTPEEDQFRMKCRQYAEKEVAPTIAQYVETASFPIGPIKKMKEYNILSDLLKPPYGKGASLVSAGLALAEFARVDGGLATFMAVQHALVCQTLEVLGSEKQKEKYLTRARDLEYLAGWGLTELDNGSDASGLQTNVKKTEGGYILNGNKRWIGNGNQDFVIVWARNLGTNKVEGFIVDTKSKGFQSTPIENKMAVRIVQNCQIYFTDVFVPEDNRLEKSHDFQSGPNRMLNHSRVGIPWISVGLCMGVYDNTIKYIMERKQFGVPIASFQIQQEKLVRITALTQAVFLMALRSTRLAEQDRSSIGVSSGVKAWITSTARDVARLGREMMGGNGIISDNYCIRALTDAEAIYTYEGTYDINSLVAARELTGISAFKSK